MVRDTHPTKIARYPSRFPLRGLAASRGGSRIPPRWHVVRRFAARGRSHRESWYEQLWERRPRRYLVHALAGFFGLTVEALAQGGVQTQRTGEFVQIGLFLTILLVDHQASGKVHLRGDFRGIRARGDLGRVDGLAQLVA